MQSAITTTTPRPAAVPPQSAGDLPQSLLAQGLATKDEYRAGREKFFPSATSLDWALRRCAAQLKAAGAIVDLGHRRFIRPERADAVFLEAGPTR